jgi:hypothetical protein
MTGLGDTSTLTATTGNFTIPITCASNQNPTPIKAWVTSPDEPTYQEASNWTCIDKATQSLQAGFTYSEGLKTWENPLAALVTTLTAIPNFANAPQFAMGLLTPLVVVGVALIVGGKR